MTMTMTFSPRLLVTLLLGATLFTGPGVGATQAALDDALALWSSTSVASYKLGYTRTCYCPEEYLSPYISVVDNGAVADVLFASNKTSVDPSSPIVADTVTVELLFERIQGAYDSDAVEVTVDYDTTFGYPVTIFIDYDTMIADEEFSLQVDSFFSIQPLADQLDAAQALWTSSGLTSYSFTFQQICEDCSTEETQPYEVQVLDGEIFSIIVSGTESTFGDNSLIQPVPELFSYLQTQLRTTALDMSMETHQEYGYPVFVAINQDDIVFTMFDLVETSAEGEQGATTEAPTAMTTTDSPTAEPTAAPVTVVTLTPTALTTTASPVVSGSTSVPDTNPPTSVPIMPTTPTTTTTTTTSAPTVDNNFIFEGSAECSANEACVGLADNCCPTNDNVFLCTYEQNIPGLIWFCLVYAHLMLFWSIGLVSLFSFSSFLLDTQIAALKTLPRLCSPRRWL